MIIRKSRDEIDQMARAGEVVADTLELIRDSLRPGVTTAELDELVARRLVLVEAELRALAPMEQRGTG